MIDTDKYAGHTEGKREIQHNAFIHIEERGLYATIAGGFTTADVELMADAALLLEAYKRLREALLRIADTANGRSFVSGHMDSFVGEVLKELIE